MEPEAQRAFPLARGPLLRQGVEIDERETSLLLAAPFDQTARLLCQIAPATEAERCAAIDPLVARLRQADPTAWPEADALHDALTEGREQSIAAATDAAVKRRLAIAVTAIAVAAAMLGVAARRRGIGAAGVANPASWALPALHLGACTGVLAGLDYRVTFSTMKPAPSFMIDAALASLAGIVVVAIAARILRPGPRAPEILLAAATIPGVLLAAFVGWDPTHLPPPIAGILVFELGPAIVGAAAASVVVAALAQRDATAAHSNARHRARI